MAEEMKKDVNVTENQEKAQETANQQPHVMPQTQQTENKTMVEVPSGLVKFCNGLKKGAKFVIPFLTAGIGAAIGIKFGSAQANKKSQVTIDGLAHELSETRLALEQKPDPIPVPEFDIPVADVVDSVPMDVVD